MRADQMTHQRLLYHCFMGRRFRAHPRRSSAGPAKRASQARDLGRAPSPRSAQQRELVGEPDPLGAGQLRCADRTSSSERLHARLSSRAFPPAARVARADWPRFVQRGQRALEGRLRDSATRRGRQRGQPLLLRPTVDLPGRLERAWASDDCSHRMHQQLAPMKDVDSDPTLRAAGQALDRDVAAEHAQERRVAGARLPRGSRGRRLQLGSTRGCATARVRSDFVRGDPELAATGTGPVNSARRPSRERPAAAPCGSSCACRLPEITQRGAPPRAEHARARLEPGSAPRSRDRSRARTRARCGCWSRAEAPTRRGHQACCARSESPRHAREPRSRARPPGARTRQTAPAPARSRRGSRSSVAPGAAPPGGRPHRARSPPHLRPRRACTQRAASRRAASALFELDVG